MKELAGAILTTTAAVCGQSVSIEVERGALDRAPERVEVLCGEHAEAIQKLVGERRRAMLLLRHEKRGLLAQVVWNRGRPYALHWVEEPGEQPARRVASLEVVGTFPQSGFLPGPEGTGRIDWRSPGRAFLARSPEYREDEHEATNRFYFEILGPDGKTPITKGPGGLYPHQRGLFAGWNRLLLPAETEGEPARVLDFWHLEKGLAQLVSTSARTRLRFVGPLVARDAVQVLWRDGEKRLLPVSELRDVTVWIPERGVRAYDANHILRVDVGKRATLSGDPHHAGVQIRLAQKYAADKSSVRFLFSEGSESRGDDVYEGVRWAAAFFEHEGRECALALLDRFASGDPKKGRVFSTRAYGRLGAFFEAELGPEQRSAGHECRLLFIDGKVAKGPFDQAWFEKRWRSYHRPIRAQLRKSDD